MSLNIILEYHMFFLYTLILTTGTAADVTVTIDLTPESSSTTLDNAVTTLTNEVTTTEDVLTTDSTTETTIGTTDSTTETTIVTTTQPSPPGSPVNVSVVSVNSTSITVSWSKPDSFPEIVHNYIIRLKQLRGNKDDLYPCNDSSVGISQTKFVLYNVTTISLDNLQPWTQYQINVSANSSYGEGSEAGFMRWTAESTPEAPYSIEIFNSSSFDVYLIWTQPCKPNGIITKYVLQYTLFTNESHLDCPVHPYTKTVDLDDNSTFQSNISDLLPWTTYTICVSAKTLVGQGANKCINKTTEEYYPAEPDSVQIFDVTSSTLSVNWTEPCNTNGIIIRYHVTYMSETNITPSDCPIDYNNGSYVTNDNSTLHQNITDLQPWTKYTFCVSAETKVGQGVENCRCIRTSEDYPKQPQSVEATPMSESAIGVKWAPPCPMTGEIQNYTIRYVKTLNTAMVPACPTEQPPEDNLESVMSYTNNITLTGLDFWSSYNICVSANTVVGKGDESCNTTKTKEYLPGEVKNLKTINVTSNSVTGCWLQPCYPNGIVTGYVVRISVLGEIQQNSTETINRCQQLDNLLSYRNYSVSVAAKTSAGNGNFTVVTVETDTDVPFIPSEVLCRSISSTSIEVTWKEGEYKTGPTNYTATATDTQDNTNVFICSARGYGNTACRLESLDEYWNYTIEIKAFTDKGHITSLPCTNRTREDAPGYVQNFTVQQYTDLESPRRVNLTWNPPTERARNGIICNYNISWTPENESTNVMLLPPDQFNLTFEVKSNINYTFQIQAITIKPGKVNTSTLFINPGVPVKPPENSSNPLIQKSMKTLHNPYRQIAVKLLPLSRLCNGANGKPELWGVIVSSDQESSKEPPFSGSRQLYSSMDRFTSIWDSAINTKPVKPYRATNNSWVPGSCQGTGNKQTISPVFVVGMDGDCIGVRGQHCNGYLHQGQLYRVKVFWCTSTACTESEYSLPIATAKEEESNNLPAVIGAVAGTVMALVLIATVSLYLWRRQIGCFRRKMHKTKEGEDNCTFVPEEMTDNRKTRPVQVSEFSSLFDNLSANSNLLFSQEYQDIEMLSPRFSTSDSELQETRMKNRYTNILPFNKTRVKLIPIEDEEGSDYINANYMPGLASAREYIATQGPLASTINDFWRMIWEQNVSIIVMLTQCLERGRKKCEHYWPKDTQEALFYGDIVIQMESESHLPDFILRTFVLRLGDVERKVRHYYYLLWPDMGTPGCTNYMIRFVDTVRRDVRPDMTGPIVVHCSAGVGRTGTFIALDTILRKLQVGENSIDVFGNVLNLRHSRLNMVQTESQFVYLHECIRDYLQPMYGNTQGLEHDHIYENL